MAEQQEGTPPPLTHVLSAAFFQLQNACSQALTGSSSGPKLKR